MDREMAAWFRGEPVLFRFAGEPVAGGPLACSGWYVDPFCHPQCCRPDGPFPSAAAAREWARALADAYAAGDREQLLSLTEAADALSEAAQRARGEG